MRLWRTTTHGLLQALTLTSTAAWKETRRSRYGCICQSIRSFSKWARAMAPCRARSRSGRNTLDCESLWSPIDGPLTSSCRLTRGRTGARVNVHGVVSASRAAFTSGAGYGGAATSAVHGAIPGYNITALQSRLAARRPFTALFLDCEGCTLAFLNEHAAFLRHPSLERVFIELDQNQAELAKVLRRLCAYGFELRASDPNLTCCPTILHLVFERAARGADASTSSTRHCPSSLSLSANFQRRAHWSAAEVSESQRLGAFAGRVFSIKWWDWAKDFLA